MRPSRVSARGLAAAAALAAMCQGVPLFAAVDAAWGQAAASGPNYSSHAASFFEELLAGRVWVLERPNSSRADDRGAAWAHYHAPDGTLLACAHLGGEYAGAEARWRVVPSRAFRALYNYLEPGAEPDPGRRRGHTPLFHDPETGALHNEATGPDGRWAIASRGWVQESWPRSMKEACPDLALPAHLPVNGRQTATGFEAMMAQDPDAARRNAPGSHLRGPGAVGIAAARGRARLPGADLARFLAENDGFVLTDTAGARHVLVLGAEGDELWLLDAEGGVADTGVLVPAAGGAEIAVHYARLPIRPRYRIGDALPFLPTGERFAAMRITDRLAADGTPAVLPFPGRAETAVRLRADGTLTAEGGGTEMVPGTWHWSRGAFVVALEGSAGEASVLGTSVSGPRVLGTSVSGTSVPWRVLADRAGGGIR